MGVADFLIFIGLFYILLTLFRLLRFLKPFFHFSPLNLLSLYGSNSYIVITGSSDGLGKAFAFSFASLGFNLLLISRSIDKLNKVRQEILALYPKISIKIIAVDFLRSREPGFFDSIYQEIQNLDISVLINNVACDYCEEFLLTSIEELNSLMIVNMEPLVFLTYRLLPQMIARNKKSIVINISSISGALPTPYFSLYSSTKAFMEAFNSTLKEEYRNKVDFLIVRPNFMSTNMNFNHKTGFETITPKDCVDGVLRDIGRSEVSNGNWKHHLLNGIYSEINESVMVWYYMNFMKGDLLKRCRIGREKMKKIE